MGKIKKILITITIVLAFLINTDILEAKENIFLEAEKQFLEEMHSHKYKATTDNKCDYRPSAIAYAFSIAEAWFWIDSKGKKSNNWTSLHPWGTYHYKRDWFSTTKNFLPWEVIRYYKNPKEWLIDFMYLYKYWYWCKIDLRHIHYYIYWNENIWWDHARHYLRLVEKKILEFNMLKNE